MGREPGSFGGREVGENGARTGTGLWASFARGRFLGTSAPIRKQGAESGKLIGAGTEIRKITQSSVIFYTPPTPSHSPTRNRVACVASVSVGFQSKKKSEERDFRSFSPAKNGKLLSPHFSRG